MIDEARTIELFGYTSNELSPRSNKKIVVVCEECGKYRVIQKNLYRHLCIRCAHIDITPSEETRCKISKSKIGIHLSEEWKHKISESKIGVTHSKETRHKMSETRSGMLLTEECKRKISESEKGKTVSNETRRRMSATAQGISYDEWESFALDQKYCPHFNESCRESNRCKYDRKCFLCGIREEDNTTFNGLQKKLSVHHVDMDKNQGCDGHKWKLIPVCMRCHPSTHTKVWQARIEWLLNNMYKMMDDI